MLRFLLFIGLFLASFSVSNTFAQDYVTNDDLDKRSRKHLEAAEGQARRQQFEAAAESLTAVLEREPRAIEALFLRGDMYFRAGQSEKAEADFEAVLAMSATFKPRLLYQLGQLEYEMEKYEEAIAHHEAYLAQAGERDRYRTRVEKYLQDAEVAAELRRNPVPFEPESVGAINTTGKEYLPAFSADGRYMVYTVNYTGREDFFYSERQADGTWSEGQPLAGVNTVENEGAQSMSADGRLLFFTGCNWPDSYGSCDLYYARRVNGEWGNLRHAALPINSKHWDTQPSLSANGDFLYFTSNRPEGGYGGSDIWRSQRGPDGKWGNPENLGPTINTKGHEQSPFLHADGQTLYFASDTHSGLGQQDIFVSRLQADGTWGTPENIGYPINTASSEGTLVVSLDGKTAYYTTDQNSQAGKLLDLDIYQFDLYEGARPQPLTYVRGRVIDANTEDELEDVSIKFTAEGKEARFAQVKTLDDGTFLVVLPLGENYALEASEEGYLFYSDRFELAENYSREEPYELLIPLRPVPLELTEAEETPIVLKNVLFATGSAELLPSSETELNRLVELLKSYPTLEIRINGHTDDVGDEESNLVLSEARAQSVLIYLVGQGVAMERLSAKGFGESRPLGKNDTAENRKQNRRTEFEIMKLGEQ